MLLTGTYNRSLDDKGRVSIPKQLRMSLGCPEGEGLFVAPGTDGSLTIYSEEAFTRWGRRLEQASPTQREVRAFTRLFYARAQRVEIDAQGRIRIPQELAQLAGLEKEVMLLGIQDHLELWALDRWQQYLEEQQQQYDRIAEVALGHEQAS